MMQLSFYNEREQPYHMNEVVILVGSERRIPLVALTQQIGEGQGRHNLLIPTATLFTNWIGIGCRRWTERMTVLTHPLLTYSLQYIERMTLFQRRGP
jgi:hypothetical protein